MDEDVYLAFRSAVIERERIKSWGQAEELLATLVDAVNALRAELATGLPVVTVKKLKAPSQPDLYPRPEWVEDTSEDADVIVMRPRDLAHKMMNGKAAS